MSTIPDKPAILYLNKHQFICKDCQKSFITETTEVKKNSNTSKNPKTGTINKVIQREFFKKTAKSCNAFTNIASRIQCELAKILNNPKTLHLLYILR